MASAAASSKRRLTGAGIHPYNPRLGLCHHQKTEQTMKIVNAECIALDIPFYADHGTRHMHRANTHAERVHVCRLEADKGRAGVRELEQEMLACLWALKSEENQ